MPGLPVADLPNTGSCHPVFVANRLQGQSCDLSQPADLNNIPFGKSCLMALTSFRARAVDDVICSVFLRQRPSQITHSVIRVISISVCDLVGRRRLGTMERCAENDVHRQTTSWAEVGPAIFASRSWSQDDARVKMPIPIAVNDQPIYRPQASKTGRLIARVAWYLAPFLDFGYRMLSHIALLQRVGQGMTEGCNQPSFPIYNRRHPRSSAITILAARV